MTVIRICFVGDSVTNGTGDPDCRGWPGRLSAALVNAHGHDVTCYNLGIRAETSSQIGTRWLNECTSRLPGHVRAGITFMFGLNDSADALGADGDGARRVPLAQSLDNAQSMMSAAKERWPVLWLGPTPVRRDNPIINPGKGVSYQFFADRAAELNGHFSDLANRLDIPYLDCHGMLNGSVEWDRTLETGDGVHPTADGYVHLAQLIESWQPWRRWFQ